MTHVSLKSAAEDKTLGAVTKSTPTFNIDPNYIIVDEAFHDEPINPELVQSYKAAWRAARDAGSPDPFPPSRVRMVGGKPHMLAGRHRRQMYLELIAEGEPIERIPCVEVKCDDAMAIIIMLGDNDGRTPKPINLGLKYAELVNRFGWSYAEVAERRGKSVQHVKDAIRLTEQAPEVVEAVQAGTISAATAMKVVKQQGAEQAAKTIKAAAAAVPTVGVKAGRITQKVLDKAGRKVVEAATVAHDATKAHLTAMLESPSFNREQKDAIRKTLRALGGRLPEMGEDIDHVGEFLKHAALVDDASIKAAVLVLQDHRAGKPRPASVGAGAEYYGHMVWLQNLAATNRYHNPAVHAAAHWFMAVLESRRSGAEVAAPPAVLSLADAIRMELDSAGSVNAESMCPEHADLVRAWRAAK